MPKIIASGPVERRRPGYYAKRRVLALWDNSELSIHTQIFADDAEDGRKSSYLWSGRYWPKGPLAEALAAFGEVLNEQGREARDDDFFDPDFPVDDYPLKP